MKKYWKFNLHFCQEQLRNVRVSPFWSCFSWDDWFCIDCLYHRQGNEQKQVAVHQILKSPSIKFIKKKSLSISNIFILSNGFPHLTKMPTIIFNSYIMPSHNLEFIHNVFLRNAKRIQKMLRKYILLLTFCWSNTRIQFHVLRWHSTHLKKDNSSR
jgi:hypothetical protein